MIDVAKEHKEFIGGCHKSVARILIEATLDPSLVSPRVCLAHGVADAAIKFSPHAGSDGVSQLCQSKPHLKLHGREASVGQRWV
jgi:hypothetical protein